MAKGIFGAFAVQTKSVGIDSALTNFFTSQVSKSGVGVDLQKALGVTTVLACARRLSEDVAGMPLKVMWDRGGSKLPAYEHSAYRLLVEKPNDWQTEYEFREGLMLHAVLTKGAIAYKNKVNGVVAELLPICSPWKVRQLDDWTVVYDVWDTKGLIGTFPREDILHLRGPGLNGFDGWDIIDKAREAIGLAIATEESQARLHSNGVRSGGLLSIDTSLGQEARDRLKQAMTDQQGVANAFKTMVLDKGATWTSFGMSGVDAQHDQTRMRQTEEICRAMGVFPQMVGHSDKTTTFASAEAFFTAHVVQSLLPWTRRNEAVFKRDLMSAPADRDLIARHVVQGLMRGAAKDRADYYSKALGSGGSPAWMTQDEIRSLEELNPLGGPAAALPIPTNVGGGKPPAGGE